MYKLFSVRLLCTVYNMSGRIPLNRNLSRKRGELVYQIRDANVVNGLVKRLKMRTFIQEFKINE